MSFPVPDLRDGLTVPARLILEKLRELLSAGGGWYVKTDKLLRAVHEVDSTHPLPDLYAILLRIVRPWICRYPLLQNQGNVGSIDGDPPAGMRYNEMRFQPLGETLLPFDKDLGVVTGGFPQLLCNGAWAHSGQVVTRLTEDAKAWGPGDYGPVDYLPLDQWEGGSLLSFLPPHNLGDMARALIHLLDHPHAELSDVIALLPAPDFPTGGSIVSDGSVRQLYETGKASLSVRGTASINPGLRGRKVIAISEIPFGVSKTLFIEQLAESVQSREYPWLSDIRDLTSREAMKVELEIRRGYDEQKVYADLLRRPPLQQRIDFDLVVGEKRLGLLALMKGFLDHRRQVMGSGSVREELEKWIPLSDGRRTRIETDA